MATKHDALSDWNKLDEGQRNALVKKLWIAGGSKKGGYESFMAILRGESRIDLVDTSLKLVDANGRCIPPTGFKFEIVDPNRKFYVTQPVIDCRAIHACVRQFLPSTFEIVSVEQFQADYEAIMAEITDNRQVANVKNGVCLPILIPKHDIGGNYGKALEDVYLEIVMASYLAQFPGRTFENWRKGELDGQVTVVDGTRHDRLIATMRERSQTAVYCQPFQGFGIEADRAMIKILPDNWLLSGSIDTAMAFAMYPTTLARDYNTTAADCAAVQWREPGLSLYFYPRGEKLGFVYRDLSANESCSSGALVLRQRQP